jgi:hypothetical protein
MNAGLSFLGAFMFLVLGLVVQAVLQRLVYPLLSERHERAKYMGRQTADPSRIMLAMRIVNFLLLPALGLLAGNWIFAR